MIGTRQNEKFLLSSLLAFGLLASMPSSADVGERPVATKTPIIFDAMTFRGKPDLGLSKELSFIYAWEATLKDEEESLAKAGSNKKSSTRTVEPYFFNRTVQKRAEFEYIVIDIESFRPDEDSIAIRYVELAKSAVPGSKVAWWNLGPRNIVNTSFRPFSNEEWQANFDKRKALVEANDFCILGFYFRSDDTIETWRARHVPRIAEARRLYGAKPIFVTLAPHYFDKGKKPWPFISGKMLGEAMDILAELQVDGIVLWSFEGTGKLQIWDEQRDWVRTVRNRTDSGGRYKRPALFQ